MNLADMVGYVDDKEATRWSRRFSLFHDDQEFEFVLSWSEDYGYDLEQETSLPDDLQAFVDDLDLFDLDDVTAERVRVGSPAL